VKICTGDIGSRFSIADYSFSFDLQSSARSFDFAVGGLAYVFIPV